MLDEALEILQAARSGEVVQHRGEPYDIVASLPPEVDPTPYGEAGATWWVVEFPPESATADTVRGVLRDGPDRS
jgi:alkanesulfonate monooxygenase SsuD/methylene tetrahydromethanopterin reductase-like flavin-dependent oxidoreductase (luciferase family)